MRVVLLALSNPLKLPLSDGARLGGRFTGNGAENIIEYAGRVCYDSYETGRPSFEFAKNILKAGHGSVLEHVSLTFHITGISRACSHELVRHRVGVAISQRSSRYCNELGSEFVDHPAMEKLSLDLKREIQEFYGTARTLYRKIQDELTAAGFDKKTTNGAARYVLPHSLSTELVWTSNVRELRHIIKMRCSPAADAEIRNLMYEVFCLAADMCPLYFQDARANKETKCVEFEYAT